jgi:gamma-glutamyltranspeptidase
MGVAQPESNGLGGGCFIVVCKFPSSLNLPLLVIDGCILTDLLWLIDNATTREVLTIDGREEAPAAFHPRVYCADAACGLDPHCTSCPDGPLGFRDRCDL